MLTYEKVRRAVLLQESVEVVPELRHPVQDVEEGLEVRRVLPCFLVRFHSFPVQVPQQEPVGRFHVVGERDHPGVKTGKSKDALNQRCTLAGFESAAAGGAGVCSNLKLRCKPWLDSIFTGWLQVPMM